MVWKKMLVEEFQNGCLVLGNLWYANQMIKVISESPFARSFLSSFCPRGYMVWKKMLVEEFQDGCLVHGHLWYQMGKILPFLTLKRALSFEDVVWRITRRLLSAWPSLVSEYNDLSIWLNWLMPTIKTLPKRTYGLEDVVWRISRCQFSEWPFLISEWDDFSYSESQCCMTHLIKFLLETIYGLDDVVWRISRCLFSSDIWMEWFYLFWVSMLHDASQ